VTVRDLLRRIWPAGAFSGDASGRKSAVSHPDLIHPATTVTNSTISGKVHIGRGSIIKDCFILARELHIGRNTSLWGPNIDIHCILNPVRIGSFCSIAHDVSIQEYSHRMDRCSTYFFSSNVFNEGMEQDIASRGPITIGNDVWIASRVVVGSGVTIGDGAVVGANSVVLEEVPPYAVVAGSPAKVLRYRFDEDMVKRLMALKWWEWDQERILRNRELFLDPLTADVLDRVV
jgi:virginiamycin A acetyltransferase